jgi:hypothetical protein
VKKADVIQFPKPTISVTTCREAQALCKQTGVRIFWRPGGIVNWMLPELDPAQILTD